ncbi:MAG: hypothetical protein J6T10_32160 [Methanobrevibacter sp.]|nr:hypothetical protein [Methanobrevibacter sp.]
MEGIEILQTIEVVTHADVWLACIVFFGIILIVFLFAVISNEAYDIPVFILISILSIALIFSIIMYKRSAKMHIEYMVTVDQRVNVVEFFDKYEVIEHEDKLWRIKEKDNDN